MSCIIHLNRILKRQRDPKQLNDHLEQGQVTTSAHNQNTLSTDVTESSDESDHPGNEQQQPRQRSGTQITENLAYGCRELEEDESDHYSVVYDYPAISSADRLEDVQYIDHQWAISNS